MKINKCRVCNRKFYKAPLLRYNNMPKAAQHLPEAKDVQNDKGIRLVICQCSGCGLVQLSNNPVYYYKQVIRSAGISTEIKDFRKKQFSSYVDKYSLKGKKVLEIGCGRGEYLTLMQQCGVKAYGLEDSIDSVKYCKKNKLNVLKGFIQNDNNKLKFSPFDAFFTLNFLEHIPDPNSVLRGICNNITDDAIGLVEVPNFDMILRKNLFSEFITDHLFYFTQNTLSTTLKLNGFEVITCHEVWYKYSISAVVKKRKTLDLSSFCQYQTKIKKEINEYLSYFKDKKVAIWGAGHQAFVIISLINLGHKIKYVIDSAPFKQGRYTPVSHLPIVSPAMLDTNPVDAIIIMAAGYSDEVARIIKKKYNKKFNLAILRDFGLEKILQ